MATRPNPPLAWPFGPRIGAPCAGVGGAASLGGLSVPATWTTTTARAESPRPLVPDTRVDAGRPGRTFQRALMATIVGRDAD
ncbi:hypothetical protein [Mycobacterium sp. E1747]|uniref:PPE family protein, SVP subgroup n=1 Tax=Mycobacterium sp. E1747 TaxID=1834128 RepID=UPI0012E9AB50